MNADKNIHTTLNDQFEECQPRAEAMIHSLRAFGYDLGMAVADIIDNSIFAKARLIKIEYSWNSGDPWVRIVDDGSGMTEEKLVEAMRLGSTSPLEVRESSDLGRFGLGLKTASFSQCTKLTVSTKTISSRTATRYWDLMHVQNTKRWELGKQPDAATCFLLDPINRLESGTVVLWQGLDRIVDHSDGAHDPESAFLRRFLGVKSHLEMVFHRFLENRRREFSIRVGEGECKAWDPYLRSNRFTQELSAEKYETGKVSVVPYVLPHVSNRTEEENTRGAGVNGWNAQQGFYVYRNNRVIVAGGYLDFDLKPEEHFKLARIQLDITNDMDHEWSVDVRKAVAYPPERLRGELMRIARVTRQRAAEVYRARGGVTRKRGTRHVTDDIWLRKRSRDKVAYHINRENPVIKQILDEIMPNKSWVNKLFHVIESTVPHRLIIMDGLEHEDCHVDYDSEMHAPPQELLNLCREMYQSKLSTGRSHEESVDIVCSIEPFDSHPGYRAYLDSFVEDEGGYGTVL